MKFDPLEPENWYSITHAQIVKKKKNASTLFRHYGGLKQALAAAYPQIRFDSDAFAGNKPKRYWCDVKHCRVFFDEFAKEKGFDPLKSDNWFGITRDEIRKEGGRSVLGHYKTYRDAIKAAYPELSRRWAPTF